MGPLWEVGQKRLTRWGKKQVAGKELRAHTFKEQKGREIVKKLAEKYRGSAQKGKERVIAKRPGPGEGNPGCYSLK